MPETVCTVSVNGFAAPAFELDLLDFFTLGTKLTLVVSLVVFRELGYNACGVKLWQERSTDFFTVNP